MPSSQLAATLLQDDIYRQNYYLSLMEFRELTMQRLKKFVDQRFFSVFDYLEGACASSSLTPLGCMPACKALD